MTLTYRSTTTEMVQIFVRDADGSTRLARLVRDAANPRRWSGSVDHPTQRFPVETFGVDAVDAVGKLATAWASRETDFRQSKARQYRPDARQIFDHSRTLPEDNRATPIVPIPSRR
jgi:hypothetical protein